MKLTTFLTPEGDERWGAVIQAPDERVAWAIAVAAADRVLADALPESERPTRQYEWAHDLAGHLTNGSAAHTALTKLLGGLDRALDTTDGPSRALLSRCGWRVDQVRLLAPLPRPRLCWGLVTNSPSFQRLRTDLPILNLYPLGHQRPQGALIGHGDQVVMTGQQHRPTFGFNVELGVVVGEGGRRIPAHDAMSHVAGYTVVTDVAGHHYYSIVPGHNGDPWHLPNGYGDWLYQVTASWGGKIADTHCPVGPYLVTRDEVPDPYDLLMWTRQQDQGASEVRTRDRAHSGASIHSIERVIAWYSSFATLHSGDIIHLGTMGVDGLPVPERSAAGTVLESEIEVLGAIRATVKVAHDPVPASEHPSHAVREEARHPRTFDKPRDWSPGQARHYYTAFGNHTDAPSVDGIPVLAVPRFLLGPATSLGPGGPVEVPERATDLIVSVELAAVVGRLTGGLSGTGGSALLGLAPMIAVADQSFADAVVEPARAGESGAPKMYARWADGFNSVGAVTSTHRWSGRAMHLQVNDRRLTGSTSVYRVGPDAMVDAIGAMTTLFPGDVISLGSTALQLRITPAEYAAGIELQAGIDGLGELAVVLRPEQPSAVQDRRTDQSEPPTTSANDGARIPLPGT